MRARELALTAHVVGRYDEPDLPEDYDIVARDYRRDVHKHTQIHPNITVLLNTNKQTEALRGGLIWLVSSWRQLQDVLRGPVHENSLARHCPYIQYVFQ